jgi:hypothetical protein
VYGRLIIPCTDNPGGDTFAQTDWQSWTSTQYDKQHRTASGRKYFLIPSTGLGTAGTNYAETDLGYDALERQNRVVGPGGTITRTVWTAPQRVQSVWVGTNDTGATDSNPAGSGSPNNMVQITDNIYDGMLAEVAAPAAPTLSDVSGGSLPATTYYVTVTYTNAAGETGVSAESSRAVAANRLIKVTSPSALSGVTGYNVYVATISGTQTRQNGGTPIAIGTDWTEPTTGLATGAPMPSGDGNLTRQTQYASATDTRVTNFGYDWRDRQTSVTDAPERLHRQHIRQPRSHDPGAAIRQPERHPDRPVANEL